MNLGNNGQLCDPIKEDFYYCNLLYASQLYCTTKSDTPHTSPFNFE